MKITIPTVFLFVVIIVLVFLLSNWNKNLNNKVTNQISVIPSPQTDFTTEFEGKVIEIKQGQYGTEKTSNLILVGENEKTASYVYVLQNTVIYDKNNQKTNFTAIRKGNNVRIKGKPGENEIAADQINLLD